MQGRAYLHCHGAVLQGFQWTSQGQVASSPIGQQLHKDMPITNSTIMQHIQTLHVTHCSPSKVPRLSIWETLLAAHIASTAAWT